jgi:hypothetical protein
MRLLLLAFISCIAAGITPQPGSCGPVLNEIMADPATDWDGSGAYSFRDDEWIEIHNPGSGALSLDGYLIGDENRKPLFGFSGVLDAGRQRVVYGGEAVAYQQTHGLGVYGLRLGNDGDTMTLLQVVGVDTLLVDSSTYNTYEAEDDRSTGRRPDGDAVWEIFDQLNPYTGTTPPLGNGRAPTPGLPNSGEQVDVVDTTWGKVRSLYH